MVGGFLPYLDLCNGTSQGAVTASSKGTTVTGGSANTKGSYAQLIASSAIDAAWMLVMFDKNPGSTSLAAIYDIAVGAAASEKIVFNNLMASGREDGLSGNMYLLPCNIPAGTRISCRSQSATASLATSVLITLFDAGFTNTEGDAGCDSLGTNTGTSLGVQLAAGSANTKTAYSQLIASTARDYQAIVLGLDANNVFTGSTDVTCLLDVAIGAAASEKDIISNFFVHKPNSVYGSIDPRQSPLFPIIIPAGTRLSTRYQASSTSSPSNNVGVSAYGVYY